MFNKYEFKYLYLFYFLYIIFVLLLSIGVVNFMNSGSSRILQKQIINLFL